MFHNSRDIEMRRLIPFFIGLSIAGLLVCDPYVSTFLGHQIDFILFPFTFSISVFLLIIGTCISSIFLSRVLKNKELLFVILSIFGCQTTAIQLGMVDLSEIVIGVFFFIFLIDIFAGKERRFVRTPMNILNLIFLFFIIISTLNELIGILLMRRYLKGIVLFFLMVNVLYSKELAPKFIKWLIIATSCSALIGIFQGVYYKISGIPLVGFISPKGLEVMFDSTPIGYMLRVPALMMGYREFAIILAITIIMVISLLIFPSPLIRNFKEKVFLYIACSLMFLAFLLTWSKTEAVGLFIALMVLPILKKPRYILHLAIVTVLLIAFLLSLLAYLPGREDNIYAMQEMTKTQKDRIQLAREGFEGFLHGGCFLFGKGVHRADSYTSHIRGWPAHNAFILVADEFGIFGLLIYISMLLWIIFRVITINLVIKDPAYLPIARGLLGGILMHLISGQFNASYLDPFLWLLFAITESMALIFAKKSKMVSRSV